MGDNFSGSRLGQHLIWATGFNTRPWLTSCDGPVVQQLALMRADQPFRRAESKYALERLGLEVTFKGGALDGLCRCERGLDLGEPEED